MSKNTERTRAELVRQRRAKIKTKEAEKVISNSLLEPVAHLRPTTPKKSFIGEKRRKSTIRRYEASALNPASQGLHPIAPARPAPLNLPHFHLEWRAISAALTITLVVIIYLLFTIPQFSITLPIISGNQYISTELLSQTLNIEGETIFTIVPENLERKLLIAHPGIAAVEVKVSLPNIAKIHIIERQPAIVWQQDGKSAWIDKEGIAFRTGPHVDGLITVSALGPPPAPAVDASAQSELAPPPFIAPDVVAALGSLIAYAPSGATIIYDPEAGLGWTDPRGWTVQLGDITEDMALKLRLYETITTWLEANHIYPLLINLEHPHAPYYRMTP